MTTVSLCYAIVALVTASVPTPEARQAKADQTMKSTPVTITATKISVPASLCVSTASIRSLNVRAWMSGRRTMPDSVRAIQS